MTYLRNGKVPTEDQKAMPKTGAPSENPNEKKGVRINGFAQVVEMLSVADKDFRESLLKRMAARDQQLVINIRADLARLYRIY